MRLTKTQRAENHDRVLEVAARLFREKGVDGVGIDEIMAAAGLTHGAFYGHFPSKTALVAEAGRYALEQSGLKQLDGDDGRLDFPELVRRYLSVDHRDHPGLGCAVAGLGADIGRQAPAVQASFAASLDPVIEDLAARLTGDPAATRRAAIVDYAAMVGAMVIARSAGTGALSTEVLDTVRAWLTEGPVQP